VSGRRGSRGRQAPRRGYYWDGLQLPTTTLASPIVGVLSGTTAQEFMPGTIVRCRGWLNFVSTATSATDVAAKIMYVEVNDAGTMTGDHAAIDTHEEDIANRQLWAYYGMVRGATAGQPDDVVRLEIDVRAKVKLVASGKWILALILGGTTGANASVAGQIRTLIMHA